MAFGNNQPETGIGVKKANVTEMLPKAVFEQRVMNIVLSKRDIVWWAELFFHIITLDHGLTKIKLYPKLKELLQHIVDNTRSIVLSARQCGKCVFKDTTVEIRNTENGKIQKITIVDFFNTVAANNDLYDFISNTIKKSDKFILSYNASYYEILTDDGWKKCKAIHKTVQYKVWKILTKTYTLKCADTHIVFNEKMQEVFAKDLKLSLLIQTETGLEEVENIIETDTYDNMYDVELDDNSNHRYYTNGILSHNTTTYTIFCLWYATLFPEKRIMVCANKLQTAIEIMDRIRKAYENLPFYMKPGILTYNKGEIEFANGSVIRACSTSSSAARGSSVGTLIIDEMSFIPKNIIDDFWASVVPMVSSSKNSKIIVVSTPNGASGLYYELWQQANSKETKTNKEGWKPFRIHWWETGGIRDEEWKKQQIASIGLERWKQEYECDFLTSATKKLIPDDITEKYQLKLTEYKLKGLTDKKCKVMSEQEDKLYEFTMWHEFDKTRTYVASGDISEGVGGDNSVLYVWDISDLRNIVMCAKFDSNSVSVVEFAFIISKILALYGNPYFIAERNGCSGGTLDALRITYKYPRLVNEGKNGEPGVFSHVTVKGKSCLWAREMLMTEGFGFTIYDKDLLEEWTTFVKKDTKGVHVVYQALPPAHDDYIMSFIWLCYLLQSDIIEKYFWVGNTFRSMLGNVYALIVKPQKEYTIEEVKTATNDPIYKDFLEFKEELMNKFGKVVELDKANNVNDIYGFALQDKYFGGIDYEPSWNGPQFEIPTQLELNPNNISPTFFIGGGGGFSF